MTTTPADKDFLYAELCTRMESLTNTPMEKFLLDHLKARTGFRKLNLFKLSGSKPIQEQVFAEMLQAIITNDTTFLSGKQNQQLSPQQVEILIVDATKGSKDILMRVPASDQDTAMATLIKLLTMPGITAQVKVEVTITKNIPEKSG